MVYIYTLEDPTLAGIRGVRYVGKTSLTFEERFSIGYNAYCKNWIKSLESKGLKPLYVEVDYVEDEDWVEAERLYIREYITIGCPLTNQTEGGEGMGGYKHTEESKTRMRINNRSGTPEVREKISATLKGHPISEETKTKISDSKMGHLTSEETRAKLSANSAMKRPEVAAKLSAALMGHTVSEETREKISLANKGKPLSEEHKTKLSLSHKGKPWSEARREAYERNKIIE